VREGFIESGVDGSLLGYVAVDGEVVLFGSVWEGQFGGVAGGGDDFVALFQALLDIVVAESCRGASDEEDLRSHFDELAMTG
jgi:hypothetical protein